MRHHSGAEHCLHDLFSRGVLVGVSSALDLDARFDEFLVILGQELCPRWIVGQVEERQEGAEDGDQAFYDELEEDEKISHFPTTSEKEIRSLTNQRKPSSPAAPLMCPTLEYQKVSKDLEHR
jgi:hypothetical protein